MAFSGSEQERLREALSFAIGAVVRWTKDGSIDIPDIDPDLTWVTNSFEPMFLRRGFLDPLWNSSEGALPPNEEFLGYELRAEADKEKIWAAMKRNARVFNLVQQRASTNALLGYSKSDLLNLVASAILSGHLFPPKKIGRPPEIERNTLLLGVVEGVQDMYGFKVGPKVPEGDDGRPQLCGAAIAWAAFASLGHGLTLRQSGKICNDPGELRGSYKRHRSLWHLGMGQSGKVANALLALNPAWASGHAEELEVALSRFK